MTDHLVNYYFMTYSFENKKGEKGCTQIVTDIHPYEYMLMFGVLVEIYKMKILLWEEITKDQYLKWQQ